MTIRFPVAVWQDFSGLFTATVLDGAQAAAVDVNAAGALAQLQKYITWTMRSGRPGVGDPDFHDCELRDHRIRIRPEYRDERETVYPVATPFEFRVTCVHGRRRDGTRHCTAPTLGIRLSYQEGDPIEELLTESLQRALGRRTPQEVSRELMPPQIVLDAVHVRERNSARKDDEPRFPALESVATLLGGRRRGVREVRAISRDNDVRLLVDRLANDRTSLLLLGSAGVGKSTVLAEAVRQLRRLKKKPNDDEAQEEKPISKRRFWRTNGQRLISGMKYLGQWEQRCEQVIEELAETGSVLCVEELLELVRVGGREPATSVAAFLQPYLERGELRIIAEASVAELDACRRLLPGFADQFQLVRIPEFSATDSRRVIDRLLQEGARNQRMELEAGLADLIYRLFRRFQPYAAFPGRSAAFVRHLLDDSQRKAKRRLAQADVLDAFQRETGLPERLLRDDLPLPHNEVLNAFRSAVLGQEDACQAAAGIVTTLKTGLNDPQRPLGVLMFCGPTGVGKTEMAKSLAKYLFGAAEAGLSQAHRDRLVRLDMSEYAGPGAAQRLMMSADGQPSDFIKRVRRQPFVVVLLDEIEKAAPEVHDVLLGVLDEGRLTDRFGRVTTFRSAVIVMTSNVGAERSKSLGFDASAHASFERIVLDAFRPEFVNRIDAIVTFQPLARDTIAALVVRELESLGRREGLAKTNLQLSWSERVVEHLADSGFDLRYGARPLQRAIERLVVAPLARWLLTHRNTRDARLSLEVDPQGQIEVVRK